MKSINKNKGITLIALVITIIVLLILAGISIATLTGDSGILKEASKAKEETKLGEVKEKVNLMILDYRMEKVDDTNLKLLEYFERKKDKGEIEDVIENQEGNIEVTIDGYIVVIDQETLTIIDIRDADYIIGTYTIKGYNQEKNVIEIAISFKSDTNIKAVICPNNETKTFSEKEIEVDYEVEDGKRYEFIVESDDKRQKYIIQTKGTTVGNKVNSEEALTEVAQLVNFGCTYENKVVTIGSNIELKGNQDNQWVPMGNETNKFKGTLDGNNKVISNLHIDSNENNQALVGWNAGTVKDITIVDSSIKSTSENAAAIVAYNDETGKIENAHNESCTVTVDDANGLANAGGICALNYGIIKGCSNNANISANTKGKVYNANAGGIVGATYSNGIYTGKCEIIESYNTGNVMATSSSRCGYSGGILGISNIERLIIQNCYNTGKISSTGILNKDPSHKYANSGGIIGYIGTDLECSYCYNIGVIEGQQYSGGILGCNDNVGKPLTKFEKLYYLDASTNYIVGNSNDITGRLNNEDMKGNVLLNSLNDKWRQLQSLNNGYPVLSWQVKE